jgi:sugar phosphate isomerase/epimerase
MNNQLSSQAAEVEGRKRMGVGTDSYGFRWSATNRTQARFKDALDFLDHCHQFGAGGIQAVIGDWDPEFVARFRAKAESWHMYLEGQIGLPRDQADVARFESRVRIAKAAGASIVRSVMLSGRRYETFDSAESFRQAGQKAWEALARAEPVVRTQRVRLALENHKDWRVPQMLDILKRIDSEYVGLCVDTGNSIALLEDPIEVIDAYAPWAFTSHLKDMAVQEYEDGFLLSEVPLGEGFLDLQKIIATLRRAKPGLPLNLEMITRDPLKVPCLTKKYWATFEGLLATVLASMLALVRANVPRKPLPQTTGLSDEQRLSLEDDNVRKSFAYAQEHLGV